MPGPSTSPAHRFAALAEVFRGRPDVSLRGESVRRGFGSAALKVRGSVFAMLAADQLVLKLPRAPRDGSARSRRRPTLRRRQGHPDEGVGHHR